MSQPPDRTTPAPRLDRVHFVGVGGAGMSGLAKILLARGATVSGSDAKNSRVLAALRVLGARVHVGHAAANVGDAEAVVVSTAIRPDNPELVEAHRRGLPVIPRAAALAGVMAGRRGVAVAGTHGKTTTTSMLTVALQQCGADPSFAIGGDLNEAGSNAHQGSGDVFVAEADESDASFLLLSPFGAIVTNVEPDHLDHYGTPDAVFGAFRNFVGRIERDGFLVVCADDPGARALLPVAAGLGVATRSYGEAPDADVRLVDVVTAGSTVTYDALEAGRRLGRVTLQVPGRHNALNSAAALAAGRALGYPFAPLAAGLAAFRGTRRRFEPKGEASSIRVIDDYAHHPTEIAATLSTARGVVPPGGRLVVVFQPHRYTRTAAFAEELGAALGLADEVVVMDVYPAGEDPIPGVSGATVAAAVPLPPDRVHYETSWSAVPRLLASIARPRDVVFTLGAGDVTLLGPELLDLLRKQGAA